MATTSTTAPPKARLGQTEYDFRGLDADTDYYFTIEALNENGRSPLCKTTKN